MLFRSASVMFACAWRLTAAFTALDLKVKEDADEALIGKQPYLIPEVQASLFTQYTFLDGALEGLALGGGVRYVGSSYADQLNTLKVPDVALVDLKLGYKKNNWGVDLNVTPTCSTRIMYRVARVFTFVPMAKDARRC